MGKKILLEVAPTGVEHYVDIDDSGDGFYSVEHTPGHIEDAILDTCAQMRGLHQRKGAAFQHAARIPINTYEQWRKEWKKSYSRDMSWSQFEVIKLNNRDNCKMRSGHQRGVYGKLL